MKTKTILLYTSLLLTLVGCSKSAETNETDQAIAPKNEVVLTTAQLKQIKLETEKLTERTLSTVLELNGKIIIAPDDKVSLSLPVGGQIVQLPQLPGSRVNKGDVLAVVSDPQFIDWQEAYLVTKEKVRLAKIEWERQTALHATLSSSDKSKQMAELDFQNQTTALRALHEKLLLIGIQPDQLTRNNLSRNTYLRAPFTGFIQQIYSNKGKYIPANEPMMELINPKGMLAEFQLFEKEWTYAQVGQTIQLNTNQSKANPILAKVIRVVAAMNEQGSSFLLAQAEKWPSDYINGTYLNGQLQTETKALPAVPTSALVDFNNQAYVFVQTNETTFQFVPIKKGIATSTWTAIQQPHQLNNQAIVTKGAYDLLMALKNEVEE